MDWRSLARERKEVRVVSMGKVVFCREEGGRSEAERGEVRIGISGDQEWSVRPGRGE